MSGGNWARLVLLSVLWGATFLFVELGLTALRPLTLVALRVSLAAGLLAVLLLATGRPFPQGAPVWGALFVMGLLNNAIPFSAFNLAQGQITGSLAAVLNATTPLFTLLVARAALGDPLTPARLCGILCGIAGVAVVSGGGAGAPLAIALCLMAALSYACAGVWGRRFRALGVDPLATAFGQLAMSSALMLPLALFLDRPWALPLPGWPVIGAVIGIAVLSTAWAYQLYFRLLAEAGPVNLLLVTFLIPVSATVLGALVLAEPVTGSQMGGFAMIAAGLAIIDGRPMRWIVAAVARRAT